MFHSDHDAARFFAGLLGIMGTIAGIIYCLPILVALRRRAFRSPLALGISFLFSAIISVPLAVLCYLNLAYGELLGSEMSVMPDPLDDWPVFNWLRADVLIMLVPALPLMYVWLAPIRQYLAFRREATQHSLPSEP